MSEVKIYKSKDPSNLDYYIGVGTSYGGFRTYTITREQVEQIIKQCKEVLSYEC